MALRPIYINCDMRMRLRGLKTIDGNIISDATVTYSLVDLSDDTVIATGTLPIQSAPNGHYWATLDRSVTSLVVEDAKYRLTYSAADGDGDERDWVLDLYGALPR